MIFGSIQIESKPINISRSGKVMNRTTTKISTVLLASVLAAIAITQITETNFASDAATVTGQDVRDKFPKIPLSDVQEQELGERAKQVDGVKSFSPSGWEFAGIEYYGVTEPIPEWTNAVVTLKLVDQSRAIKQCEYNIYATVDFELETGKITDSRFPTIDTECKKGISLGRSTSAVQSETENPIPKFIPQADAGSYYYAATNENAGKYGGWVFMTTPTIDETEIYDGMNHYLGFTFNQDFGASKFLQGGWLVTTEEGCINCGIDAESTNMVYVDEAWWGDAQPRKMAGTTYADNSQAIVYILCDETETEYQIKMWYSSTMYTRVSGVDCDNSTTGAVTDNSVFIENANTGSSSAWADDITTVVKAWAADEYDTPTSTQDWQDSLAKKRNCSGSISTTSDIDGNLENSNTATWDSLSSAGVAC